MTHHTKSPLRIYFPIQIYSVLGHRMMEDQALRGNNIYCLQNCRVLWVLAYDSLKITLLDAESQYPSTFSAMILKQLVDQNKPFMGQSQIAIHSLKTDQMPLLIRPL